MKLSGSKQPPVGDDSLEGSSLNVVMLRYDEFVGSVVDQVGGWSKMMKASLVDVWLLDQRLPPNESLMLTLFPLVSLRRCRLFLTNE